MYYQRTLAQEIGAVGIGLHSGRQVRIVLKPAPVDHGIVFHRVDGKRTVVIEAHADRVVNTSFATTIGRDGAHIGTVEHLLAALYGMGIDNLLVEVHGDEVPIMDGSAGPFVFLIKSAGIRRQAAPKKFIVIREPVRVVDGEKEAVLEPHDRLQISCRIRFSHPLINIQDFDFSFSDISFERLVSRARTFGFLREVEVLKANNLARGGSLDNAVVLDDFGVVNPDGLRFADEFVRHKVLDCLGDISLLGMPVIGRLRAVCTGHALNHRLVQALRERPCAWEVVVPGAVSARPARNVDAVRPAMVPVPQAAG
ncbi:MAG: UDP-3-O-acyl-N-acetylglucosamine deacetylase [Deltaproteobacteria bacterium]|nr:UDP-3-O-acyl-N-acetylglucosamine deacetylase [Candidatus Anaeroferrophillacea bacterium]